MTTYRPDPSQAGIFGQRRLQPVPASRGRAAGPWGCGQVLSRKGRRPGGRSGWSSSSDAHTVSATAWTSSVVPTCAPLPDDPRGCVMWTWMAIRTGLPYLSHRRSSILLAQAQRNVGLAKEVIIPLSAGYPARSGRPARTGRVSLLEVRVVVDPTGLHDACVPVDRPVVCQVLVSVAREVRPGGPMHPWSLSNAGIPVRGVMTVPAITVLTAYPWSISPRPSSGPSTQPAHACACCRRRRSP